MQNYSKEIETQFFRVFYDIKDTNIIDQIIAVIDKTYENTIQMFHLKKDIYKFILYICPDVQSFKTLTGKADDEYKEWMVGNADYTNRRLCILSPNVVHGKTFENMIKICKHEVIHIAFEQLGNPGATDIFIAEGIAVALAEQIDISKLDLENYPLANRLFDENYFYRNNGYLYSGVYVLYIIKKYGVDAYKRIYTQEDSLDKYLYGGFEKDAIQSLLSEYNIKRDL